MAIFCGHRLRIKSLWGGGGLLDAHSRCITMVASAFQIITVFLDLAQDSVSFLPLQVLSVLPLLPGLSI